MIDSVLARAKLRNLFAAMEAERKVLLYGPLSDLPKISAKRDQVLESLVMGGAVSRQILATRLPEIKELAGRNAALLKASMDGMKDAQKAIESMEENLNQMDTYSRDGTRMLVAQTLPGKGHRV